MAAVALTVSLNNFYYWYQDRSLSKVLSWVIPLYAKKVNGFEISLPFNQCESWISELSNSNRCLPEIYSCISEYAQSVILACKYNSIHLEDIKSLPLGKELWLAECLNIINQHTGISNFTTHPDEVSADRWAIIARNLNSKISLSIENMCKRKLNYKKLDELAAMLLENPNINVTFDTSHWLEFGFSLGSPEIINFLRKFGHRIDKIHCSAPNSCEVLYRSCPDTPHFAFYNSEHQNAMNDLVNLFSYTNALIVLEGLVPVQGVEILDKEIALITNLIDLASAPIERHEYPI